IYIDDPFVLDEIDNFIFNKIPHRHLLIDKLSFDNKNNKVIGEIITERRIDAILSRINYVCDGELERNLSINVGYKVKNSNKILDIKNVSLGLKTFIIIKTLLLRGIIKENGIIILDEPEIHLHPEWQIIFAELIVMIQKEFNMHVLINTHSPYFLNAIEIYSLEHNIENKCKYYLAENIDNYSRIIDVSEDIEKIYTKLARPFQELESRHYGKNDKK
ncbi:AAA family ATPase, partial [Campylobacter concisus]|uniref:AAA family ATPase n=2 Tax=Campylobacter concisus TaxID=199 RepID=UPI00164FE076